MFHGGVIDRLTRGLRELRQENFTRLVKVSRNPPESRLKKVLSKVPNTFWSFVNVSSSFLEIRLEVSEKRKSSLSASLKFDKVHEDRPSWSTIFLRVF